MYAKNENPSEVNFDISKWISSGPGTFGLVYPELRPGELRPDNSGRLIQARPNSGPAIPIQAGPNSGPSHLRPACPNSGQCHFRPGQLRPMPTQASANSGQVVPFQAHFNSGSSHLRLVPFQAHHNSGQDVLTHACANSGLPNSGQAALTQASANSGPSQSKKFRVVVW